MTIAARAMHAPGQGSLYRYNNGCRCAECREKVRVRRRRQREIGRVQNTASYQRELAAARRLKAEVYAGTCERCGGKTTGCNGPGKAPTVCTNCVAAVYGQRFREERLGRGPVVEKLLAFIDEPRTWTEIRLHLGKSPGHVSALLNHNLKVGLIIRLRRGVYQRADVNGNGAA